MTKIEELLKELSELQEVTEDFNKFKHLFSEDEGTKTLAKIRRCASNIKLHAEFTKIKKIGHPEGKPIDATSQTGSFVKVRPCGKEFKGKTYLGIFIGDAALSSSVSIEEDEIVCSWSYYNPAILIPELNKITYGIESWWGEIETPEDLEEISDKTIENVWYVQALKSLKKET